MNALGKNSGFAKHTFKYGEYGKGFAYENNILIILMLCAKIPNSQKIHLTYKNNIDNLNGLGDNSGIAKHTFKPKFNMDSSFVKISI